MRAHIEYDDFGEYIEVLEEINEFKALSCQGKEHHLIKTISRKLTLLVAFLTIVFGTPSYAARTCALKGCYRTAVFGGSYCKCHTCSKSSCKNFSSNGTYCSEHQEEDYSGSSSSSEKASRVTCSVSGCSKLVASGSSYCYQHKCKQSGCKEYGIKNGYCLSHTKKSGSSGSSKGKSGSSSYSKQCIVSGCHNNRAGGSSYCTKHKCGQSGCSRRAESGGYCESHRWKASDPYDVYEYDDPEDFYYDWEYDFEDYEDAEDYWSEAWE